MLLVSTLFLLTFSTIFSSNTSEENMNITATVIKPLRVVHNGDINYGNIIQGSTHTTTGHVFTIYGEPKQNVDITLNEKNINASNKPIPLIHEKNSSKTLSVQLKNEKDDGKETKLNDKGEYRYSFDTELKVPHDALVGDYSGTLTMKVRFK